jgi:hypothetical protein
MTLSHDKDRVRSQRRRCEQTYQDVQHASRRRRAHTRRLRQLRTPTPDTGIDLHVDPLQTLIPLRNVVLLSTYVYTNPHKPDRTFYDFHGGSHFMCLCAGHDGKLHVGIEFVTNVVPGF